MSNSQNFFNFNKQIAEAVNDVMESYIEPILVEERKKLIEEGKKPEEIEKRLREAKIDAQATYLPVLNKKFKERLQEETNKENAGNSLTPTSTSRP